MDESPLDTRATRGQRARLTCTECNRRKIRCDKNIPCGGCIKRGNGVSCTREDSVPTRPTPTRSIPDEVPEANEVVRALLLRVSELESRLHHRDDSPSDKGVDAPQDCARPLTQAAHDSIERAAVGEVTIPADANNKNQDEATVLEFLAWGRKKDSDFVNAPEHESGPRLHNFSQNEGASLTDYLAESTKCAQLDILEALLPSRDHINQLVGYHNNSLLWYHGSYSSKVFSDDLQVFFTEYGGDIRHQNLNLQWLALLFAIMTGSMTCASEHTRRVWGFSDSEKAPLSLQWYSATVTCLNMAKYIDVHTIYSVQAIATLTISAHILGNSNSQSVLLASAGRIAQSLGLHNLGSEPATATVEQRRKREAGKRVFCQLCTQDWFSIPFSESYSLNPRFFSTVKPLNCDDDDMIIRPLSTPTQASYCNFLYDIAALMPQLQDAMAGCNTLFTKYEQVLKYDEKMRNLATASMPTFLSNNAPVSAEWPSYVNWARRSLTICAAHKIIMIHRRFVGLSFSNTAFSFTRRTCVAASNTILREAFAARDELGPVLWIDQAFAVAAGIILSLDMIHGKPGENKFEEQRKLVADTIGYLKRFEQSKIAVRGVHLLSFLEQELDANGPTSSRKRAAPTESIGFPPSRKRTRAFNIQAFIRDVSQNLGVTPPTPDANPEPEGPVDEGAWEAFMDLLPPQTGFDGQYLFGSLLPTQL